VEAKPIDLVAEVARGEVAIDLGGDGRLLMAEDALHGGGVGACHHQERGRRVP
jgi:hypothetical protein